jgi:hypothetical protein
VLTLFAASAMAVTMAGVASAQSETTFERSVWQMHRGDAPVVLDKAIKQHGAASLYKSASIPAADADGWVAPPLDETGAISFSEASILPAGSCLKQADFTYFQTLVDIPADAEVTEFEVRFHQVDDGARAYVFNSANPDGAFVKGGDILFGGTPVTANLAELVVPGEANRVVIVQVDDCPMGNNLRDAQLFVNGVVTVETAPIDTATPEPVAADPIAELATAGTWFELRSNPTNEDERCLESNGVGDGNAMLGGASFLDVCSGVSGQLWHLIPAADGYFQLQSQLHEADGNCLEGNSVGKDSFLGGAAFMDACQDATGQLWRFVPAGEDTYRLVTKFLESEDKCLEGNTISDTAVLGGAAFQDQCKDVTGQLWRIAPV